MTRRWLVKRMQTADVLFQNEVCMEIRSPLGSGCVISLGEPMRRRTMIQRIACRLDTGS